MCIFTLEIETTGAVKEQKTDDRFFCALRAAKRGEDRKSVIKHRLESLCSDKKVLNIE
jgi:hypothetical protein